MAEATEIATVRDAIEANFIDHGWDEQVIIDRLDSGSIPERVIAAYWRMRASATILLVNTSESGSSRGNDTLYPRFKALADEWDAKATAIETPPTVTETRGRLSSFPMKRA
jgi:hypothetical protein